MLDTIDYKLCELLQTRGRASQLELAQAVNLSQPAVAERIRKLEEQGVIIGYAAQVNAKALGKDITAFIGVFTNHPRYHDGFVKKVTAIEEVQECHRVAGTDSYLLKIRTENTSSLDTLIARIRSIDGCERTQTTIVMATLKESTHVTPTQPEAAAPKAILKPRKARKQK
jgi:Lrp/AsnC family leucine-responsive transcriptional regulator